LVHALLYSLKLNYFLGSKFEIKDMGEANVTLNVRIVRKGDNILLPQEQYIEKILRKFEYFDFIIVSTLYDVNSKLKKNRGEFISQPRYSQIIRTLLHLMSFSRSNIVFARVRLSRYAQCANQKHWDTLAILMTYLRGSMDFALNIVDFSLY